MDDVREDQATDVHRHESFVRQSIGASVHEVEHLHEIADEGESAATPAILAAAALAFVLPLAAIVMVLVFTIAHFA